MNSVTQYKTFKEFKKAEIKLCIIVSLIMLLCSSIFFTISMEMGIGASVIIF